MIRERPCDEPRSWGMSYCSSPRTRTPRRARCATAALPIPPTPTTMTSYASTGTSSLCHRHGRPRKTRKTALRAMWLKNQLETKPQAKIDSEDNEGQAPIMDGPFLLLLLRFDRRRQRRFEGHSSAPIFDALVTIVVALWHL